MRGRWIQRWRVRPPSFAANQDGQVLLMAAILSLTLVAFVAAIVPVGQAITAKIQLQNAADAAAMTAATWMARGSNFHQGMNGVHWDYNIIQAEAIISYAVSQDSKISEDLEIPIIGEIKAAIDLAEGMKKIRSMNDDHTSMANTIADIQSTINEGMPLLAYFNANSMATDCGADVFNVAALPFANKIPGIQTINSLIQQISSIMGGASPHCWTLNPDLWPPTCTAFAVSKKASSGDIEKMSFAADPIIPFLPCTAPFLVFITWNDTYYVSTDNVGKPVTMAATRNARPAFMLNSLLLRPQDRQTTSNLVPMASAVGTAVMYGDTLYPSGVKSPVYFSIPGSMMCVDPIPALRMVGVYGGYHGNFAARQTNVLFMGFSGKDILIFH